MWSSARGTLHDGRAAPAPALLPWRLDELDGADGTDPMHGLFPSFDDLDEELDPHAEYHLAREDEAAPASPFAEQLRLAEVHRAEVEQAAAEAYARGLEEGRRLGEEGEAARLRHALFAAEAALDEVRQGEMRWTGSIEENICALAVAVARQVIGRELQCDADTVVELVRGALREFPVDQPIRIRVNPGDLLAMQALAEDGTPTVARDRDARWLPDPLIGAGGCVVEGRERIVDGRVDTALERIYRRLTYNHG